MTNEELEELEELGKRAVACEKHGRWMPGMLFDGLRVLEVNDEGVHFASPNRGEGFYYFEELEGCGFVPDLSDPATRGCLFAQFCEHLPDGREAWMLSSGQVLTTVKILRGGTGFPVHFDNVLAALAALDAALETP